MGWSGMEDRIAAVEDSLDGEAAARDLIRRALEIVAENMAETEKVIEGLQTDVAYLKRKAAGLSQPFNFFQSSGTGTGPGLLSDVLREMREAERTAE